MTATDRRNWLLVGLMLVAVALTIGGVVLVRVIERHDTPFLERLADDAGFGGDPWSCRLDVQQTNPQTQKAWPAAVQTTSVACLTSDNDPFVNGLIEYVRFADATALRRALATTTTRHPICMLGDALVVDWGAPRFRRMCGEHHGRIDE